MAAAPSIVVDIAAWAGALLAVLGVLAALGRVPFVRKTWKRSVTGPYWQAHRDLIVEATEPQFKAIKAELRTNGGSSLRDAVDRVERDVQEFRGEVVERIASLEARVGMLEDDSR